MDEPSNENGNRIHPPRILRDKFRPARKERMVQCWDLNPKVQAKGPDGDLSFYVRFGHERAHAMTRAQMLELAEALVEMAQYQGEK